MGWPRNGVKNGTQNSNKLALVRAEAWSWAREFHFFLLVSTGVAFFTLFSEKRGKMSLTNEKSTISIDREQETAKWGPGW